MIETNPGTDGGDACENPDRNPAAHPAISDEPPIPDKEDLPGEPRPAEPE